MSRRIWIVFALVVVAATAFWLGRGPQTAPGHREAANPANAEPMPAAPPVERPSVSTTPKPADPPAVAQPPITSPVALGMGAPIVTTTAKPADAPPAATPAPVQRRAPNEEDPAKTEADLVALNIRHFSQRFGGNPTGTNAEIVKALINGNGKGARYLPPDLTRLNDQGELIDRWDTPYFFHQMSADHMEVRSAGPDRQLWTTDDVVTR